MMLRRSITLLIVFTSLTASAEPVMCQTVWDLSNSSTEAARAGESTTDVTETTASPEVQRLLDDPAIIVPEETSLDSVQRHLLRQIFLDVILDGAKAVFNRRTWSKDGVFRDASEVASTKTENDIYKFLSTLVKKNQLRYFLDRLLSFAMKLPVLGKKLETKEALLRGYVIPGAVDAAQAMVAMRGLVGKDRKSWVTWNKLSRNARRTVEASATSRLIPVANSIKEPVYMNELLKLANTSFVKADNVDLLVNGSESFPVRHQLMAAAKSEVDVMVWAILDDYTGKTESERLIALHNQGKLVRVMVDGQVNQYVGYGDRVKDLERAGIEVVRWRSKDTPYLVQHRKVIFGDTEHGIEAIGGGINIGDTYSHQNPDPAVARWRDTDVRMTGDAAISSYRLFAELWNQQLELYPEKYGHYHRATVPDAPAEVAAGTEGVKLAVIESLPGPTQPNGSPIMLAMLKAIDGAEKSVDIENAYVVLNPVMKKSIQNAIKRGVKVRVLTNSDTSVDEAIVSKPIMMAAHTLAKMGAEVYLKKGATLHSKVMNVDGRLTFVKSYNFHPRSERTDGEIAFMIEDLNAATGFGARTTAMFNADIAPDKATQVNDPKDVKFDEGLVDRIMLMLSMRLGYDVL